MATCLMASPYDESRKQLFEMLTEVLNGASYCEMDKASAKFYLQNLNTLIGCLELNFPKW